ncbi:MAG TPA: hypothetical protein PKK23_12045 [Nitrospirales bacterium]|nr:hypothetical protein [Nitrospiraceae bacterium]HNP29772.1 hypothetical protein [Nitrospirales bacterium]
MLVIMESLPELVGTVHIILGPYRGNPIALYMRQDESRCHISPRIYPWNQTVGIGDTPNKAAADFEAKWKKNDLADDMYTGPHWEGGIKPEKPKPVPPPKPATPPPGKTEGAPEAKISSPESPVTSDPLQPARKAEDAAP